MIKSKLLGALMIGIASVYGIAGIFGLLQWITALSVMSTFIAAVVIDAVLAIFLVVCLRVVWLWKERADPAQLIERLERKIAFYVILGTLFVFLYGWPERIFGILRDILRDYHWVTWHSNYIATFITFEIGAVGLHLWRRKDEPNPPIFDNTDEIA